MAKILIVDDSRLARRMLSQILEAAGHDVVEAEDGMVALEKFLIESPDLVFLDLAMPGISGLEVLAKICQMDAKARVIVATADIQSSTRGMAKEAGASGFVIKPFQDSDVLKEVNSVLDA